MRVSVDRHCCQGHALCTVEAPEVFELSDEDGYAYVSSPEVPMGWEDKVRRAAAACPEQAISFTE